MTENKDTTIISSISAKLAVFVWKKKGPWWRWQGRPIVVWSPFREEKKNKCVLWDGLQRHCENYMINIHNKANLVPDVTVSFSQIPTIPKDGLSLSLSLSNIHTKKSTMITAAILSFFFLRLPTVYLTNMNVPLITYTRINWRKLLWNAKFALLCHGEERQYSTKLYGNSEM